MLALDGTKTKSNLGANAILVAVSYTHLDVYKRQDMFHSNRHKIN